MLVLAAVHAHQPDPCRALVRDALAAVGHEVRFVAGIADAKSDVLVIATDAARVVDSVLQMHQVVAQALMNLCLRLMSSPSARAYVLIAGDGIDAQAVRAAIPANESEMVKSLGKDRVRFFVDATEMAAAIAAAQPNA